MLAVVSTIRDSKERVDRFLAWYRSVGVSRFYIALDSVDSADATPNDFSSCSDIDIIEIPDSLLARDINEKQTYVATEALTRARTQKYTWLLHVDIDEFLVFRGSENKKLSSYLSEIITGYTAVVIFPPFEAIPSHTGITIPEKEVSSFRTLPCFCNPGTSENKRLRRHLCFLFLRTIGLFFDNKSFPKGRYFFSHTLGKSAVNERFFMSLSGVHRPRKKDLKELGEVYIARDWALLHFDGCNYQDWKRKWARQAARDVSNISESFSRKSERSSYVNARDSEDTLEKLFSSRFCFSPLQLWILKILGLLKSETKVATFFLQEYR